MKSALVILAPGFEEIEALTPVDLLRRSGVTVTVAGLQAGPVPGSHGISVLADRDLGADEGLFDALVLPGGGRGSENLARDARVARLVHAHLEAGRLVAAICAAPAVVLHPLGVLAGKQATCFPGCEDGKSGVHWRTEPCVRDGQIITARGVGAAADFAAALIDALLGGSMARDILERTVHDRPPRCHMAG